MDPAHYPQNAFGPLMAGLVIGGMGIVHVFLAQFAVGGGFVLLAMERWAATGAEPRARDFVRGFFRTLVLISFVAGALTGVGMWFTAIQVSPRTIGAMVSEFHWLWAAEWCFFSLEVLAGYAFYRYGERLPDRTRRRLLALYALAAWMSLFLINGILSWQLTPGSWPETGRVWDGFFNQSFWPSLVYRTLVSLSIAALVALLVVNLQGDLQRDERHRLERRLTSLLAPMVLMVPVGVWFLAVLPPDSREWVLGGSVAMTLFLNLAVGASLLIGVYAWVATRQRLFVSGASAALLVALAFGATAGGEFVREGVRKPFTVRRTLYSNSIRADEVAALRARGSVTDDPYPLADDARYPNDELRLGAKVFRFQCSVCHTLEGMNGLAHLMGTWSPEQRRLNVAQLQNTKGFMPPFAGTAVELEALVRLVEWELAGAPAAWSPSPASPADLARIDAWLDEAGTAPASARAREEQR